MVEPNSIKPVVSVIVPAYNEARWIEHTVRAVLAQQLGEDERIEVIVVDAASSDDTCDRVAAMPVQLLRSGQRSSYVARNLGIEAAEAELLAFLDADCIPDAGWLAALVGCSRREDAGYVAGRIENAIAIDNLANRLLAQRTSAEVRKSAALNGHVAAGNMLVHRKVFECLGPFEPVASGADIRQSRKALANGVRIAYAENAVVRHQCDLGTLDYLRRRYRIRRGQAAAIPAGMRKPFAAVAQALRPGIGEARRMANSMNSGWWKVWPLLWAERWAEGFGWLAGSLANE
ncbi:MAG: glycosyltransferase family 2 protein [Thermomonas sp.]|uniref:glycosyltransferase n=1 Tax=Thermomonas sp. TaxID=1971895 RepID=UPI001D35D81B|nr:glycosyltransferase family A protein [Thermomonas sp.]MBZ0087652.1 glycosyltransferase family 2 protein [Thermomonas sp.]